MEKRIVAVKDFSPNSFALVNLLAFDAGIKEPCAQNPFAWDARAPACLPKTPFKASTISVAVGSPARDEEAINNVAVMAAMPCWIKFIFILHLLITGVRLKTIP
jgi:hypothetical protein